MNSSPITTDVEYLAFNKNVYFGELRVLIPNKLRLRVLQQLHDGDLGIVKMKSIACGWFWWPELEKNIY